MEELGSVSEVHGLELKLMAISALGGDGSGQKLLSCMFDDIIQKTEAGYQDEAQRLLQELELICEGRCEVCLEQCFLLFGLKKDIALRAGVKNRPLEPLFLRS